MSRNRKIVVTLGIMLSLFMASMESTVIATAMPTIVSQLGGLEHYSWVFAAFMLTSTTFVPLYGKLSDLYGRRRVYLVAMILFLLGSLFCGLARTMPQLIIFRALQGLGAAGVLPLVFIMTGEMFTFEQRARVQGFFSGVWGVSSIVGPLLGGFIVDRLSWPWVFYINLLPGLIALGLVWFGWRDQAATGKKPVVDYVGAGLLTLGVVTLLLGLMDPGSLTSWALIGVTILLFVALAQVERRAPDPILPLPLFRKRLFTGSILHGLFSGWAMFGSLSFVPLFAQAVHGATPTEAGAMLTPMLLGWVAASVIGSRLLLKLNYRTLAVAGAISLAVGASLLALLGAHTNAIALMGFLTIMGIGMGLAISSFLIAVQSAVERRFLGTATSMLQFSRSIGGTLGVSVMGALLSLRLSASLQAAGQDLSAVDRLLAPDPTTGAVVDNAMRGMVADALGSVFFVAFIGSILALIAVLILTPREQIARADSQQSVHAGEGEEAMPMLGLE
ncbi:MAG: MDR family MFS transporter [Caldilineaceae bacterium]